MSTEEEILLLTRENNMMLKKICSYIDANSTDAVKLNNTIREFVINVVANSMNR